MSDASESVLVETRYSAFKNSSRNVFKDHETENQVENSNKLLNGNSQKVTSQNSRGMRRTNSCPLFLLLRQDALEGKKVRLGRGALEYLRNRQERSLSRSFSQSDLATIKEVEEELEDTIPTETDSQVLAEGQRHSWYDKKVEYRQPKLSENVHMTEEARKELLDKATKLNGSGSSRVSRRTLEKLAEDYSKRKIGATHPQLPPLPRSRNLAAYENGRNILEQSRNRAYELSARNNVMSTGTARENKVCSNHSFSPSLEPDYYSVYHGVFVTKPNNSSSNSDDGTNASEFPEYRKENGNISERNELVSKREHSLFTTEKENSGVFIEDSVDSYLLQNNLYLGRTVMEPPYVWKIPENHQWIGHDVRTNEYGGWWTERWGCSLNKNFRFGDKYGVDNDGSAWAEWWLERDLDIQEGGATIFVKKGKRWGYNQKNESWMESWQMTADGTYYTEFQMIPPNEFSGSY